MTPLTKIQPTFARRQARGIRNNNPGNIELTDIPWKGKVPRDQNTDGRFEQYITALFGIRAIVRELKTGAKRGEDTIREIIGQWAPPNENDTEAYIRSVSKQTGLGADQRVNVDVHMFELVSAIIVHENGFNPYSDELIFNAIAAA